MARTVDKLQAELTKSVFHYAKDGKKAAGRALGVLVELIAYYRFAAWGFGPNMMIERGVPEFGRPDITHNVEFSLHKRVKQAAFQITQDAKPWTKARLEKAQVTSLGALTRDARLIEGDGLIRNAAVFADDGANGLVLNITGVQGQMLTVEESLLDRRPRAIVECKRVGVEEGMKKGPQSIEKAKQGAYVARSISSLQKVINANGDRIGFLPQPSGVPLIRPYADLLAEIVAGTIPLPDHFVLTIGVTSNHGNWFTAQTQNKEMRVLAAAYDWLLFLTDEGLMDFVDDCILKPGSDTQFIADAFKASYVHVNGKKGKNRLTKTTLDIAADRQLRAYFKANAARIDGWFNVIAPANKNIGDLPAQLRQLLAH